MDTTRMRTAGPLVYTVDSLLYMQSVQRGLWVDVRPIHSLLAI